MEKNIRAFIAFELPTDITWLAADLQNRLKDQGLKLRWVRPQNMHLTLKFLGDVGADRIGAITAAMKAIAQGVPPMALTVQGMGVFPGMRKPRVVWIGVGGATDLLERAHRGVDERLALLGFQREDRPFKAHLTLARINQPVDARRLLETIQMEGGYGARPFQANEMVLFQSVLKPQGPTYTPLVRAVLKGTV